MKLLLLSPRGFCAGVEMAVQALERALELFPPPVYVFHQIVHNRHVVSAFESRGVVFVESVEEVPFGATLLFSAHGVAPLVREQSARRRLTVIDATCPLVLKVHNEAKRFAAAGAGVILVGHRGHDEVIGVEGEAPGRITVVESVEEVDRLDEPPAGFVTQTTLSVTETREIVGRLRERFPSAQVPPKDDICYATENRQDALRRAAKGAGLAIVIGSANSSNTTRLLETATGCGLAAHRIDSATELDFTWFADVATCILTAGASVPEPVVQTVIAAIAAHVDVEIEERQFIVETQHFALPPALQSLSRSQGR